MTNITKITAIKQYSASATSHTKSILNKNYIGQILSKGDVDNDPNRSSNNHHFIIDDFYENVLNVKASYQRLYQSDDESQFSKQFVRNHITELIQLILDLIDDLDDLTKIAKSLDERYGTHYYFYLESILQAHQPQLEAIGCYLENHKLRFDRKTYIHAILIQPERLWFLFENHSGLIDHLLLFNARIKSSSHGVRSQGNIIDYTT